MNLTKYSKNRLLNTFAQWEVPKEYADPLYNYLVFGFYPGSFWAAALANDFQGAIMRSHPANTIGALKAAVGWLNDTLEHGVAWGDYHAVEHWLREMTPAERRSVLESNRLVYTEQEEMVLVLRDEPTHEPILW